MSKSIRNKKFVSIAGGYISENITQRFTDRTIDIFQDTDRLTELANNWSNGAKDKVQGRMFEQLEVVKFNFDALKKDSDLFAKTTDSMGLPHDKVDIVIKRGKETLREVQAKSYQTANLSANALSMPDKNSTVCKYDSMGRLLPIEQGEDALKYLDQKIETNPDGFRVERFKNTKNNLQNKLNHEGISSTGTTRQEAIAATDINAAEKIADEFKVKSALTDMHESGIRAGNVGALLAGSTSTVTGLYSLHKGDIEAGELLTRVAVDSAKGYATGYVVTAMSKGLTHSTTYFLGESVARTFARSNAPVAIASGVVNASKSFISYINGDIDSEQLLDEVSHTAITSTSSFYYGALGQVAIPIPVVGAVIGAGVGYFIGNMLHQSGLIALGDSRVVKEAKERRYAVQAMCLAAIPEIQKHRLELENYLDSYFSERKNEFLASFNILDHSLYNWNPDEFVSGLERINNQFGTSLQFKSFSEFNALMISDEVFEF
ncbi:MAG: hypothetical protein ACKN9F_09205 [Methylomonas sp.]